MSTQDQNPGGQTPADLAAIAAAVDELAARERRSAPVTLEDRLFVATRAHLAAGGHATADAGTDDGALLKVHTRRIWTRSRVAAALAVCGAAAAIWMAQLAQPRQQPVVLADGVDLVRLEADLELLLTIRTVADGSERIDDLYLDAEEVRSSLDDDWSGTFLDEGVL
jgi:hypothetical protein